MWDYFGREGSDHERECDHHIELQAAVRVGPVGRLQRLCKEREPGDEGVVDQCMHLLLELSLQCAEPIDAREENALWGR